MQRLRAWIRDHGLALVWVVQPLVAGPAFASALDPRDDAFRTTASIGLWATWAVTLVATLVPRTTTLTLVRIVVPASLGAAIWAAAVTPEPGWRDGLALAATALAAVVSLAPSTGQRFVNGSSYGPERRFPLRAPGLVVLGLLEVVWVVVVVGAVAGPLLLAATNWVAGAVATAVGWPLAFGGVRSLHRLSQRWLVFVPGGLALVDPLTLIDSISMPRNRMVAIGPAPADTTAHDLTAGALGLALQIDFDEPIAISPLVASRDGTQTTVEVTQILITPTRPGAVLREARDRRLPVS